MKLYIINREGKVNYADRHNLPEIETDLNLFPDNTVVQGEIAYLENGVCVFGGSQTRCATQHAEPAKIKQFPITLLTYDILMLNGEDLTQRPLLERKEILKKFIDEHPFKCIRYTHHVLNDGTEMYRNAKEGVIAKKANSLYIHDRSASWIKLKHHLDEIFQVIGYTEGEGERTGTFGSLVMTFEGKYVGKAGTFRGFGKIDRGNISRLLHARPKMPKTVSDRAVGETYTSVATALKVRVQFTRWTPDHHIREPVITDVFYPEGEQEERKTMNVPWLQ